MGRWTRLLTLAVHWRWRRLASVSGVRVAIDRCATSVRGMLETTRRGRCAVVERGARRHPCGPRPSQPAARPGAQGSPQRPAPAACAGQTQNADSRLRSHRRSTLKQLALETNRSVFPGDTLVPIARSRVGRAFRLRAASRRFPMAQGVQALLPDAIAVSSARVSTARIRLPDELQPPCVGRNLAGFQIALATGSLARTPFASVRTLYIPGVCLSIGSAKQ